MYLLLKMLSVLNWSCGSSFLCICYLRFTLLLCALSWSSGRNGLKDEALLGFDKMSIVYHALDRKKD